MRALGAVASCILRVGSYLWCDGSPSEAVVDRLALEEAGLIRANGMPVKVLGDGELDRALTVRVDAVSASARTKIEAAGGVVELVESVDA